MGVRRGDFEQFRRGGVWRPGTLAGGIPALSGAAALQWMANAAKSKGAAEAAKADLAGAGFKFVGNVMSKIQGVYDAQDAEYRAAVKEKAEYEMSVRGGAEYQPTVARELAQKVENAKAARDSWRTKFGMNVSTKEISAAEAAHSLVAAQDMPPDAVYGIKKRCAELGIEL